MRIVTVLLLINSIKRKLKWLTHVNEVDVVRMMKTYDGALYGSD